LATLTVIAIRKDEGNHLSWFWDFSFFQSWKIILSKPGIKLKKKSLILR
jgi:hypothetical protein